MVHPRDARRLYIILLVKEFVLRDTVSLIHARVSNFRKSKSAEQTLCWFGAALFNISMAPLVTGLVAICIRNVHSFICFLHFKYSKSNLELKYSTTVLQFNH